MVNQLYSVTYLIDQMLEGQCNTKCTFEGTLHHFTTFFRAAKKDNMTQTHFMTLKTTPRNKSMFIEQSSPH